MVTLLCLNFTVKMFRGVAQEENWFEFNLASTVPASAQSILNLKMESQLRSLRLLCQIQRAGDCRCFWGEFTAKKMWENKGENTEYSWRRFDLFHIPDSLFPLVLYYQYYILELYYSFYSFILMMSVQRQLREFFKKCVCYIRWSKSTERTNSILYKNK